MLQRADPFQERRKTGLWLDEQTDAMWFYLMQSASVIAFQIEWSYHKQVMLLTLTGSVHLATQDDLTDDWNKYFTT